MNKDQVKGATKQAVGKVQQKAGEILDSEKHQAKGIWLAMDFWILERNGVLPAIGID